MLANLSNLIKNTVFNFLRTVFYYFHKKFLWGVFSKINEKFFKFLFVGFINTSFSYFLYALFLSLGFEAQIALFFQYIFGVLWNFKTTGVFVFKNKNNMLIFRFVFCYVLTFFVNSLFLKILMKYLNEYIAQAILILPVAMFSFVLLNKMVFKTKQ